MKGLLFAFRVYSCEFRGFKRLTDLCSSFFNGGFPYPPGLAVAGHSPEGRLPIYSGNQTTEDKKSEGFLWGVPKHRRTVEKRTTRKFGLKEWVWKMYIPRYNLRICDYCGHHYEAKHLCRNCYEKTKEETKIIRESIDKQFGHSAVDKDVIVLYESDKAKGPNANTTGLSSAPADNKLVIEFPKERPSFFSHNLLQKSTAGINRKAKDVTTTDPIPIVHKTED